LDEYSLKTDLDWPGTEYLGLRSWTAWIPC